MNLEFVILRYNLVPITVTPRALHTLERGTGPYALAVTQLQDQNTRLNAQNAQLQGRITQLDRTPNSTWKMALQEVRLKLYEEIGSGTHPYFIVRPR